MRSSAHYRSHPIHPALIPFPFAFLTGALLFDVAGTLLERPALWTTGAHLTLAGLAAGLLAAVPGAIDYVHAVPPRSSAKTRALRHGILNVVALVLFACAWLARGEAGGPGIATLLLEGFGALALLYSGWMGGTLVTRNLISVDHRYADAGRWREATFTSEPGKPLAVAPADALKVDQMMLLHINGRRVVLARTLKGYTAFDDRCTHRGGSLAAGVMIDGTAQCLWHGSQFDGTTGAVVCGPAKTPIAVYTARIEGDQVILPDPPN